MEPNSTKRMIGIIGCKLFEDELVHLLLRDQDLAHLLVIDSEDSKGLWDKLGKSEPHFTMERIKQEDISSLIATEEPSVLLWIKPMALHSRPEKLNQDVTESIKLIQGKCRVVLLFYGLCGNAFKKIDRTVQKFSIPVVILKDQKGAIIDDCIGAVLGGTDEYYEQLKKSSGTFFLTPMWADNWRELFHKVQILPDPSDIEGAKFIFQSVGYKKVLKLDTGLGDQELFDKQIEEFATIFGFDKNAIKCTLKVVEDTYDAAKRF
jgi:hypothetical protein